MRRRMIRFFLGTLYVALVAALLITHTRQIAGELERTMALFETLLLAVPILVTLILYVRIKEPEAKEEATGSNAKIITDLSGLQDKIGQDMLTAREWEIAWMLYRGYSNRQIAEEFYIAETTVKKHASHIYEKLGVSGRKEFREKYK